MVRLTDMSEYHELVLQHGVDGARKLAAGKHDRRLIEIAAKILADDTERMGISHAGFALTSLPHRHTNATVWQRDGYRVKLVLESGRDESTKWVGLPYGSKARMILLYLQTQAIRNNSREVELGPSMRSWLTAMGAHTGGMTYRQVTEQTCRISACRLTFFTHLDELRLRQNGAFVDQEITLFSNPDGRQQLLWQESVTINELFFNSLKQHPVPLAENALRNISSSSFAIDVYIWLAYRLHILEKAVPIGWPAIHAQFGAGFKHVRHLKPTFLGALKLAQTVYPGSRIDIDWETGIVLHPSPPPVAKLLR
jgi:hypothetical protein